MNLQFETRPTVTLITGTFTNGAVTATVSGDTTAGIAAQQCGQCGEWFFFRSISCTVYHNGACCHQYDEPAVAPPRRKRIADALRNLADSELYRALFK